MARDYVLDRGDDSDPTRLKSLLEGRLDAFAIELFDRIGLQSGWHCFELGAGAGSITRHLCDAVGTEGRVVAMDLAIEMLKGIGSPMLELREGDATTATLGNHEFDLVYTRWTLLHIREREAVLRKLIDAVKPGGWILCIEPHRVEWDELDESVEDDMRQRHHAAQEWIAKDRAKRGVHWYFGRSIYSRLLNAGFEDVSAEGRFEVVTGDSDRGMAYHATQAQFRRAKDMPQREIEQQIDYQRSPDFVRWGDPAVATWGRRPSD